ncbi:hypothetical protein P691DRAFT_785537, partial [Macrolepiota fuliginosa MF-IS2]
MCNEKAMMPEFIAAPNSVLVSEQDHGTLGFAISTRTSSLPAQRPDASSKKPEQTLPPPPIITEAQRPMSDHDIFGLHLDQGLHHHNDSWQQILYPSLVPNMATTPICESCHPSLVMAIEIPQGQILFTTDAIPAIQEDSSWDMAADNGHCRGAAEMPGLQSRKADRNVVCVEDDKVLQEEMEEDQHHRVGGGHSEEENI